MRLESEIIEEELIEGFDVIEETIIKLDEVEKYINRIKDEFKKTYASEYFNYIKGESNEPEVPSALSFLDAQKVRINIQGMTEGLLFESPIQVKGWTQSSVEKFGKTIGKNPQQHGFFDACVSRMEGKKGFDSDKAKRFCASIKDASYGSAFWRGKGKKKKDIEKDVKKKPFPKMDLTERKFDLGSGTMGNGVVVWNRAKEVHGDYEKVAHIDRNRKIKYYIKNPPKQVKDYAEKIAKGKNFAGSTSQPHMKVFKED